MSRLIDAEHFEQMLIDLIDRGDHKNAYVHHAYKMRNIAIKECRKMLWEEPTVDAVPVVRCKDCKYYELDSWAKVNGIPLIVAHHICKRWGEGCKTDENGFCFMGEKVRNDETVFISCNETREYSGDNS